MNEKISKTRKTSKWNKRTRLATFDYFNLVFMVLMMITMVYPFWYTIIGSFNEGSDYMRGGVYLWPRKFTVYNYKDVFLDPQILHAFWVTIWNCIVGTLTSLLFLNYAIRCRFVQY